MMEFLWRDMIKEEEERKLGDLRSRRTSVANLKWNRLAIGHGPPEIYTTHTVCSTARDVCELVQGCDQLKYRTTIT